MDFGLKDGVALITGGAGGIGTAEALCFAEEGMCIAVNDIDATSAQRLVDRLSERAFRAAAFCGDACDENAVQRVVDEVMAHFGRLDVLVNNAGIGVKPAYEVADMPLAAWDGMVQSHLRSTFLFSRAALKPMRAAKSGRIVNTSSMNFTGGGRPGVAHYAAAKAGIAGFTRTLAKEVGRYGITANAIAPGYVDTALIGGFTNDMRARLAEQNPVGRTCKPEEVAALVAFLASGQAAFINGALVCMDGGRRDFYWGQQC